VNKDYHSTETNDADGGIDIKYSSDTAAFVLYSIDCQSQAVRGLCFRVVRAPGRPCVVR